MPLMLALSMLAAPVSPAQAEAVFTEGIGGANPFNDVNVGSYSAPSFVDVDGDGDMDAFIGEWDGTINYYENTGAPLAPIFTAQTAGDNPFNTVDVGDFSTPSFVDVDADGDMDAFIGEEDGNINYYKNTGTPLAPAFTEQTAGDNPFNGVYGGWYSTPSFVDGDGDGDMDAFIGEYSGDLKYYENTGTPLAPIFTEQTGVDNPFDAVNVGSSTLSRLHHWIQFSQFNSGIGRGKLPIDPSFARIS